MKKLIYGLIAATFLTAGVFFISSNVVKAEPDYPYLKMPVNLDDDCYSTGGNCLEEVEVIGDPN